MRKTSILFILALLFTLPIMAQKDKKNKKAEEDEEIEQMEIDGQIVSILIQNGDTIIIADLDDVSVKSPRKFKDNDEYRYYLRMKYHAAKVYPYAVEAVKVFREVEYWSQDKKKRQRKKHIKRLQKDLKEKFENPLKNLTKTQGHILVEMVERETGANTFRIIKSLKGGVKAAWWHNLGKIWGYDLKEGYIPENDPILESILSTFDVSHDVD